MRAKIQLIASHRWPFPIHLAAAFARYSCTVEAVVPRNHILARSRYVASWRCYTPFRSAQALEEAISAGAPDILVPCDDRAVRQLVGVYDRVRGERAVARLI